MAFGGWMGGAIYDGAGSYAPAFLAGVAFNLGNVAVISTLLLRLRPGPLRAVAA
jgi:hypothetical protein